MDSEDNVLAKHHMRLDPQLPLTLKWNISLTSQPQKAGPTPIDSLPKHYPGAGISAGSVDTAQKSFLAPSPTPSCPGDPARCPGGRKRKPGAAGPPGAWCQRTTLPKFLTIFRLQNLLQVGGSILISSNATCFLLAVDCPRENSFHSFEYLS